MELTVDEFSESRDAVESTAESYGGCVSDSNECINRQSGGTYHSGQLIIRIPSEDFSAFMTGMKAPGEVERVETNSEDAAGQPIDIEARLNNLRAQRDHLHDLYGSVNTTGDVLAVEEHLTDVQTKIERLEAQK